MVPGNEDGEEPQERLPDAAAEEAVGGGAPMDRQQVSDATGAAPSGESAGSAGASGQAGEPDHGRRAQQGAQPTTGPANDTGPDPASGRSARTASAGARGRSSDTAEQAQDKAEQAQDKLASVLSNFNAPIYAPGSTFGIAGAAPEKHQRRARTGRLTPADIAAALDHYVEPTHFEEAVNALRRDRVAVLVGPAGIGKGASAIALLRQVTDGPLAVLSPAVTISELAEREFKRDIGYVVKDWQHDQSADQVTDFTWRTLRDQICEAPAHLVITTTSTRMRGTAESVRHIDWAPPAVRDLLASYLNGTQSESLIDGIIDVLPGDCGVGPTVGVAQRLLDGEDLAKALEPLGSDAAMRVREWFAEERSPKEILEVVALAFAVGHSERTFEAMLVGLEKAAEGAGYALDAEAIGKKRKKAKPRQLRPTRGERDRAGGLISRETIVVEGAARSIVKFRVDDYRYHVLAEGWRNYDGTFWGVVRYWLNAMVEDSVADGDTDAQMTVAAGLATLARVDMSEVEESYLSPWAGGSLGWPGQIVATYVLWWMCFDDGLAPVALRIATRWATAGDSARRWTAATAFSGELGARYPTEATNRLWHLIVQARDSTGTAFALAQLFATLAAVGQSAGQVLSLLDQRRAPLDRRPDDVSGERRDLRLRTLVAVATLAVLSIRDTRSGLPSVTFFLHANPDRIATVTRLWAFVLRYRPLRWRALKALADATTAFDNASDKPKENAEELGRAFAGVLWPGEPELLATDLVNLQNHAKRKRGEAEEIMGALLAALETLTSAKAGEPK